MDAQSVSKAIIEAQQIADEILSLVAAFAPGVAIPAEVAKQIVDLTAKYASVSIAAYGTASGLPITAENIASLLPNPAPLTDPDA